MSWHKVDDGLHAHRKTRRVRRSHPSKKRDVAPFGLWVLAGSWCGDNREHAGFVPLEVLEEFDDDAYELAERLVSAGLWHPHEQDGEPGYLFHDYEDYNPEDAATSGTYGNHVRWHVNKGIIKADCPECDNVLNGDSSPRIAPDSHPIIAPESGRTSDRTSPPNRLPDPTRPDPTHTRPSKDARSARSTGFDEFWRIYPRKVGRGKAEAAWKKATKKAEPATIIAALREQLPSLAMQRKTDGDYRPHPTTWLNGERWEDSVEDVSDAPVDPLWRGAM